MNADLYFRRGAISSAALLLALQAPVLAAEPPAPTPPTALVAADLSPPDPLTGVIFSLIPGFGLGHYLIGDEAGGTKFLVLDLITMLAWTVGPSVVSVIEGNEPDMTSRTGFWVFAGGITAWTAIKVWEVTSANAFAQARRQAATAPPVRFGFGPDGAAVDVQVLRF